MVKSRRRLMSLFCLSVLRWLTSDPVLAQVRPRLPQLAPTPQPELRPLPPLPPPQDLLTPPPPLPPEIPALPPVEGEVTIVVKEWQVKGSTVFSQAELAAVLAPFLNRPLTLTELLQARSAITQLYLERGYITSGAFLPPQEQDLESGSVTLQVIEGTVEDIIIQGNRRLRSSYIRDRLRLVTSTPLNVNDLVEGLRLLQLNPLLESITSELSAGVQPGTSILTVQVNEADSFSLDLITDNYNTPTVGTWERILDINEGNLLGWGDSLNIRYINTNGSNQLDTTYRRPVNARNGTLALRFNFSSSRVIEEPFEELDINSQNYFSELTYRQPIIQTPRREVALSLSASYQESRSVFLEDILGESVPFPSLGSDAEGRIRLPVFKFAQDWLEQGNQEVFVLRSELNFGFNASAVEDFSELDDNFFIWRGQAQWVRLLAPDTLFLLRSQLQFTNNSLVSLEQASLGGWYTVRGYRQDFFFTDNGVQVSAEARLPLYRAPRISGLLQGIVFVDAGVGWNVEQSNPDPNTLVGVGLGLEWRQSDRLAANVFWAIPLISTPAQGDIGQEQRIYFSVQYRLF